MMAFYSFVVIVAVFAALLWWSFPALDSNRWIAAKFCVYCDNELTNYEEAYSNGICPHCSYNSQSTFCDVVLKPYRYLPRENPLNIFEKQKRVFKDVNEK